MKRKPGTCMKNIGCVVVALVAVLCCRSELFAKDTDIYSVNVKQNCYVLMDNSLSMGFGVYEHTIDYGAMFDYLFTLNDAGSYTDYIYDTITNSSYFYQNHKQARRIYLWKGAIGATIATVDGKSVVFSGDAADPDYLWYSNDLVDTHTLIDTDGNLSDDGTGLRRITVDPDGYILLDGVRLPLGLDIKAHDFATLYNGSIVDNGFNGLLNAPGYYFSGYEGVALNALDQVESGDTNVYFFVTGNWVNMQAMYNLHYTTNNPTPTGAFQYDAAWHFEPFPVTPDSWSQIAHALDYPAGTVNYANKLTETTTAQTIVSAGAQYLQIHFSAFDVQGNSNVATFTKDYVKIYDQAGNVVAQYDNDNKPTNYNDGWSPVITGDTATLKLASDNTTTGTGYTIDKIRVVYVVAAGGSYLMQSRLDVAKDALVYVVDEFRSKMNWGFATFKDGDGATINSALNPNLNDDENRAAIVEHIEGVTAIGKTPLMEALQDVFEQGYFNKRNELNNLLCRKNYIISMTDGFPSADDDAARIGGVTFADWDKDNWTQDPYQDLGHLPDYYDDVAHWLYTHSWLDKTEVADPANSYFNVTTHHIAFGAKHPLLQDAAGESGGEYIVAYNKEQLVAAFYSLALMMSEAVSFTAPVVSVDAVNKIQSGDDLYMGLFLPQDSTYWSGNVKKFKLGDGSTDRPDLWMIYDAANKDAINSTGQFLDNTAAFWGDDTDVNDTDNYGTADIKEDGAGEVLVEDVQGFFAAETYWNRPIYTYKGGALVKFDRAHITAADLGVVDDATRDKLINFTHGYTYDAVAVTGAPLGVRDWILGPIVHSRPVVVDYFDTNLATLPLLKRFVAVGANDGMLHVFDDATGREVFAFIPEDILPKLKEVQLAVSMYDTVDGLITLYRRDKNPKYLIFGERRGGRTFWTLDVHDQNPLNWTVAWNYTHAEISQSWSEVKVASIPYAITAAGERKYKDVAIFSGGYDPEEDNFPEPFNDINLSGTPYMDNGALEPAEWSKTDGSQDVYPNDLYDEYNPSMNESGRGIFVVDIDDPAAVTMATLSDASTTQILPFSATYGAADLASGAAQTFSGMKFCFPATPSVVGLTERYFYTSGDITLSGLAENVLQALYAVDIYANLFKVKLDFETKNNGTTESPSWVVSNSAWNVKKIFAANPGSLSASGQLGGGVDVTDQGRKAFYAPAISWGGSGNYFDSGNYFFPNVTFSGRDAIASLFFGTGDREHPRYAMIRNRFYALYDDSSIAAKEYNPDGSLKQDIAVSTVPYTENKLLNLTCDELGVDSPLSIADKAALNALLTDEAVYGSIPALENGSNEDDAKGWYIVLEDQGKCAVALATATTTSDPDNHVGEQILSQPALYFGVLYFTSYQPAVSDPCNPHGNGFAYSLDYANASAPLDLNSANGEKQYLTDRYVKYLNVYGIPSGFTIVTREGHAAAMASMGGSIIGGGETVDGGVPPYEIPSSGKGLDLYYWRDSSSLQP